MDDVLDDMPAEPEELKLLGNKVCPFCMQPVPDLSALGWTYHIESLSCRTAQQELGTVIPR